RRRSGDGAGAYADPRDGRAGQDQRLHENPARVVRGVRLERRAHDARRDHAVPPRLALQHLRGLVLVAHGHRPAPHPDGPQAGEVPPERALARRALAGAARAREPALPARAAAVSLAWALLEELLHRRRRRPEDLGTVFTAAAAQARARDGAALARRAPGPARRTRGQ